MSELLRGPSDNPISPEAEYRKPIKDAYDVIDEEPGFYPNGSSFRGGLVAIGRIYQITRLMQSIVRYARLVNIGAVSAGHSTETSGTDNCFLAGETLALHAIARPLPNQIKRGY